ncbi:AI-2E family transporter [Desulforhopalus sp. IMCC35007]|uniref:AI-2E family transporter n=1 Tax=Desulforhopalus sp. IMCC35007 TaxID=2569543 RepID=UPI0010AEE34D|nr:AI-2E family transporter [Desulforhopalus sp. IMCC35007]TKB10843.1 AI-2E family transporter [Desulforhopalus sp. IMCC35007]
MKTSHPPFSSLPHPWDRIVLHIAIVMVWGLLFALVFLLRSFFLLLFLTFVFSTIQVNGVARLDKFIKNRTFRVFLVEILFLAVLSMVGVFLLPKVKVQTELFMSQFPSYLKRVDQEIHELSINYPLLAEILPELVVEAPENNKKAVETNVIEYSPSRSMLQQLLKVGEESGGIENVNHVLGTLGNIGGKIAAVTSTFILSILFSFLILLDLPRLAASVRELENTKLRFIYLSVADDIRDFSLVLGRALEAQLIIATVNSILTAIGISILGIGEHVAFLSVIVFFCSFIPVIGVFISSVPICLIALQTSGIQIMFLAVLLIAFIHLIEGYILNPRIYGSYMRINPVIILIILTIGGKLFGFGGLLLGVPFCTYLFGYAIRIRDKS